MSRHHHPPSKSPFSVLSVLVTFIASSSTLMASPEETFLTNCIACHQLENTNDLVVGPSLVEISHIYKEDLNGFIKWCNAPGKKRKNAIAMPSMAHVGDKDLEAVYHYIIKATKGKKFKKPRETKVDPYGLIGDDAKKPRIQRIFMPHASPASIAVTLDGDHSLCWDTVSCRLRYIWKGGFINGYPYWQSNGGSMAKILGIIYYQSTAKLQSGITSSYDESPSFEGYKIINELPVFSYRIGAMLVSETIENIAGGVRLKIEIPNAPSEVKYLLGDLSNTNLTHSSGRLEEGALILTAKEASSFELTFNPKPTVK